MMAIDFITYGGKVNGLACDDDHHIFKWNVKHCNVFFSVCRKGNSVSCHFSSDRQGLKHLRVAINQFVGFCYCMYDWCEMVLAIVSIASVGRLITKCGFKKIAYNDKYRIYMRVKQ